MSTRCNEIQSRLPNPEAEAVYDLRNGASRPGQVVFPDCAVCQRHAISRRRPTQGQLQQRNEILGDLKELGEQVQSLRT